MYIYIYILYVYNFVVVKARAKGDTREVEKTKKEAEDDAVTLEG